MMLSKRRLLQALAGAAALSVTAGAQASLFAAEPVDPAGAAEIGKAWLALHPATAKALGEQLFPHGADRSMLSRLADRIHHDFRKGAIFQHKGWFLSDTEARLCALIALS